MGKSVAVIGAGPSGLCATKELLQEKHSVLCFERTDSIGGIFTFRQDPCAVGVWRSCKLTSSALVTCFSDFFPEWESAEPFRHCHFTHRQYLEYLRRYAEHFDLVRCIRFGCEVTAASPGENGDWLVTISDKSGSQTLRFDAVAVCTGVHRVPYTPELPGLADFRGQILHAAHYKTPTSIRGTSAVFIGAGESGSEIVAEASKKLNRSYVSLRRGVYVIPRLINGLPNDYTSTRLLYSLPEFVVRRSDAGARSLKQKLFWALFPFGLARTAVVRMQRLLKRAANRRRAEARLATVAGKLGREKAAAALVNESAVRAKVEKLIHDLRRQSRGNQFDTFATKTEGFIEAIVQGRSELRPATASVTPTGVIFTDGTSVDVDAIVLCTGFDAASTPFIKPPIDLRELYANCFTVEHRERLAFLGFVRPPLGAIPPMAEMQSRWFAQILSGNCTLPSGAEMQADIERRRDKREAYFNQVFRRLPHLVDYSTYLDELAERVGCKPRARDLLLKPVLLYKLYTSAFSGVQFRLRGPHARPQLAERILRHTPSHFMAVRFGDLAFAKLAGFLGLRRFQPRLSLTHARAPTSADLVQ